MNHQPLYPWWVEALAIIGFLVMCAGLGYLIPGAL